MVIRSSKASGSCPALGGVEAQWEEKDKLHEWIRNNVKLTASGYPKAVEVSKTSPTVMNTFEDLTDTQIDEEGRPALHREEELQQEVNSLKRQLEEGLNEVCALTDKLKEHKQGQVESIYSKIVSFLSNLCTERGCKNN